MILDVHADLFDEDLESVAAARDDAREAAREAAGVGTPLQEMRVSAEASRSPGRRTANEPRASACADHR